MKKFTTYPQSNVVASHKCSETRYIRSSVSLDEQDVLDIIQQTQPEDAEYIKYSFEFDGELLSLRADAKDSLNELGEDYAERVEELAWDAISAINDWATNIAKTINSDTKWTHFANSILHGLEYDWYSGMTFSYSGTPFTYEGFTYNVINE